MKPILLILALALSVPAQTGLDWKSVAKDPNIKIYVAEIARGPKEVKFWLRFDFPNGDPIGLPIPNVGSVRTEATFNCVKKTAKLTKGFALFYDKYGSFIQKAKDEETVKTVPSSVGDYISEYFCERGGPATVAPKLKPKT